MKPLLWAVIITVLLFMPMKTYATYPGTKQKVIANTVSYMQEQNVNPNIEPGYIVLEGGQLIITSTFYPGHSVRYYSVQFYNIYCEDSGVYRGKWRVAGQVQSWLLTSLEADPWYKYADQSCEDPHPVKENNLGGSPVCLR